MVSLLLSEAIAKDKLGINKNDVNWLTNIFNIFQTGFILKVKEILLISFLINILPCQ